MFSYEDSVTYNLVGAASKILNISVEDFLINLGKFWITYTANEGYGELMEMAGTTFPQFLSNLDNMHTRVGLIYSKLKPPSFVVNEIDNENLLLEYHSDRHGLASLVNGLLLGLGEKFNLKIVVEHTKSKQDNKFDEFKINYRSPK